MGVTGAEFSWITNHTTITRSEMQVLLARTLPSGIPGRHISLSVYKRTFPENYLRRTTHGELEPNILFSYGNMDMHSASQIASLNINI